MPNTREKLVELLSIGHDCPDGRNPFLEESCSTCPYGKAKNCGAEMSADHLIANGVTVQTEDEQRNTYTALEIEEIQNEAYDLGVDSVLHNKFGLSWEDAAGLRKEIKRLQDATKWIPVTERLPDRKEYDWVLVLPELTPEGYYGVPAVAELRNGKWYISDCVEPFEEAFNVKVTHWMPLPEPPKEVSHTF